MMSITLLIYLISARGYIAISYRASTFSGLSISNTQFSSLEPFLLWEIHCTSKQICASICLQTKTCLSFLNDGQSGMCQLFSVHVDIISGITSANLRIYQKQVSCEELGYLSLPSTTKCLKLYSTPMQWINANSTCASAGGKLFSVRTASMFDDVLNAIAQTDPLVYYFFVDGNDIESESNWVYSDGSPVSFLRWGYLQPDKDNLENCILIITGEYHDIDCGHTLAKFICEKDFTIVL